MANIAILADVPCQNGANANRIVGMTNKYPNAAAVTGVPTELARNRETRVPKAWMGFFNNATAPIRSMDRHPARHRDVRLQKNYICERYVSVAD